MARQMKDSGVEWIGEIPAEWEVTKIKNKMEFINGYAFDSNSLKSTGKYSVIRIGDIADGTINAKQANKIDYNDNTLEKYIIKDNDVIIAMSGATVGKLGYVIQMSDKCYINQRVGIIRSQISRYIFYYLSTDEFLKYINLLAAGSAQPNISTENINNYFISIPPSQDEIKKILNFLDKRVREIDFVIVKTKETIEDYKKYKQVIITDAVTKGLNTDVEMKESKNRYLGVFPAHWVEKRLRFLGMCQNGISKSSEYFGEGYPFVSYGDVYKNYTLPEKGSGLIKSSEDDRKIYSVQYGDVFFTRTSETIEEVGFASTCLKTIYDATFAGFVIRFRPNNQEELLPEFSKYYFRSDIHRKFFVKEMNLVTRASLSQELLKKLPVLLPPLKEQKKIARYLDEKCSEIDKLIAKKEELLADLESYKKSLIYEYVTGKKEIEQEIGLR
ncbi:MAG: restriction endonuclease subunit S [Lachnospiraceae bacterium]|nr:restriction endonuclease subunit S [Lachnospiraceae bacterium]